jgi:hypothetical protein
MLVTCFGMTVQEHIKVGLFLSPQAQGLALGVEPVVML